MEKSNGIEEKPPALRVIEALVEQKNGSIISLLTSHTSGFDSEVDLEKVECTFVPHVGDGIKISIENGPPIKVKCIEPNEEVRSHIGHITRLEDHFGVVDQNIVFFIEENEAKLEFSLNDKVQCTFIDGVYEMDDNRFESRCVTIEKFHESNEMNGKNDLNGNDDKIPNDEAPPIYRELRAAVNKIEGSKLHPLTADPHIFEDVIDLNEVECDFTPYEGDDINLIILVGPPLKVARIENDEELRLYTGVVTQATKSFGIVDDEIIFFVNDGEQQFKHQDRVQCTVIEGQYKIGKSEYKLRCESIKKIDENSDEIKQWFGDSVENVAQVNVEAADSEVGVEPQMQFEALRGRNPNEKFYDLPYGLKDTLQSKNAHRIKRKLDSMVPAELNYNTYKTRMHALIYLEEVEMTISFEQYVSREIWIDPENKRFSIMCTKITELRPPIAVGDKIQVRNLNDQSYFYRGVVERVLHDRFILKFKKDFIEHYRVGDRFSAQFFHNRVVFMRKHAAVEYAKQKLSEAFLFPKQLTLANDLQLDAMIQGEDLVVNGRQTPWFQDLNSEQKEAVAGALRGECRPNPFIIFGPPGTGKTSSLIEIICQVYTHIPDCKILIATQSNHAANIVASRLIASHSDIGRDMLRLVSNAALDRKSLPKDLHKFSASVLNSKVDVEIDDVVEYEDTPKNVKRNCQLEYLKGFKIIIGTFVGLGILFNSEFGDKYFTHAIIDEAAQSSECEAMIPISCINLDRGQVIMAGDPLQLPPISLSNHARHYDMVKSMLERYVEMYKVLNGIEVPEESGFDPRLVVRLRKNYRSLPSILNYYNKQFYNSALVPTICGSTSFEATKLPILSKIFPHCSRTDGNQPFGLTFVNVEGRNERQNNKKSWENKEETDIVETFIKKLLSTDFEQDDIGVITPYHAQVLALRRRLKQFKKLRVGTVEQFQGEEKMVIIFSAVKTSGTPKGLRFIYCPKRLNTAVSRARMLVVIFGKVALLKGDSNWDALIEYCANNNAFIEGKELVQMI